MKKVNLSNWTNFPERQTRFQEHSFEDDAVQAVKTLKPIITRGNGRCYGDASLGENVLSTLSQNNILSFDKKTGILDCQSGVLLSELLEVIVPEGWFLPVTPGTKFITIGGAIASNVHGKNHHKEGGFSKHVLSMRLLVPDGQIKEIQPNDKVFDLTCGGMGLTGVILSAKIQLKKIETSYIRYRSMKAKNLDEAMRLFDENKSYTYSMAWIDCLQTGKAIGRSILMLGEHAKVEEITVKEKLTCTNKTLFTMPFNFPSWVLNTFSIKAFNFLYYHKHWQQEQNKIVHYDGFYYPLDAINEWNRMYGKRGFIQYQPIFPLDKSYEGLKELLHAIARSGYGSFLGVLKLMGKEDNDISFPMEGYTIALDFPIKKGLFEFLKKLDDIVMRYDGRLYLSKDARMSADMFANSYQDAQTLKVELRKFDPEKIFVSDQSQRLDIK